MNLLNKTVLVTGSTTGIGEACARAFAEVGAGVMVCGRHAERGRAVRDAIRAAGGIAEFIAVDLRGPEDCHPAAGGPGCFGEQRGHPIHGRRARYHE